MFPEVTEPKCKVRCEFYMNGKAWKNPNTWGNLPLATPKKIEELVNKNLTPVPHTACISFLSVSVTLLD